MQDRFARRIVVLAGPSAFGGFAGSALASSDKSEQYCECNDTASSEGTILRLLHFK